MPGTWTWLLAHTFSSHVSRIIIGRLHPRPFERAPRDLVSVADLL